MNHEQLGAIQAAIRSHDIDGWLFCDVWNRDPLAYRALNLDSAQVTSRRWFYLIPGAGVPVKLVHRIEGKRLASLPGETLVYSRWQELHSNLQRMLAACRRVAMQYSPNNDLFTISYVDAGTVELVRSFGLEVVSSANLLQQFVARLDSDGIESHLEASRRLHSIKDGAFELIFSAVREKKPITEIDVQSFILDRFQAEGLTSDNLKPVVAVNDHAADPHFEVSEETNSSIEASDRILIDLWGRMDKPDSVYADITWCGYTGSVPPPKYVELFDIVIKARNAAMSQVVDRLSTGREVQGWEVDDAARSVIVEAGYGDSFSHRTGHSIDGRVHGSGVNIDNYETRDHRLILPGSCFSIEPGIYTGDIGVRSEIDILVDEVSKVHSGPEQQSLIVMR